MRRRELPRLGLGTWENTDPETCAESVRVAIESGYRHIDTAQGYDNEAAVSEGIGRAAVDRDEIFLATKLLEYAREHDHWLVAYSPLARGTVFDVDEIAAIAEKHAVTPAQVGLAWLLAKDGVAAIPKSASEAHIRENLHAQPLELDPEDHERIDSIDRRHREVDFDGAPWNR